MMVVIMVTGADLVGQRIEIDSLTKVRLSLNPLCFAGIYPSLEIGLNYRLSSQATFDSEFSFLLPKTNGQLNRNVGYIYKLGYLRSFAHPQHFWVFRAYFRDERILGRAEFSRFNESFIQILDVKNTERLLGLTIGWLRESHYNSCDVHMGMSLGGGRLTKASNIPDDAVQLNRNFLNEPDLSLIHI